MLRWTPRKEGTLGTHLGGTQEEDNPHSLHHHRDYEYSSNPIDTKIGEKRKVTKKKKKASKKYKFFKDTIPIDR